MSACNLIISYVHINKSHVNTFYQAFLHTLTCMYGAEICQRVIQIDLVYL